MRPSGQLAWMRWTTPAITGSWGEAVAVHAYLRGHGLQSALVVSDPPHMLRLRYAWGANFGGSPERFSLVATRPPWWSAWRWWQSPQGAAFVLNEVPKLLGYIWHYGLGLPLVGTGAAGAPLWLHRKIGCACAALGDAVNTRISVVTAVYNRASTIAEALHSSLSQQYPAVERVVIDGGSADGTVEVVRALGERIDTFISEADHGIYDALNKGVDVATGDVVGFLHADDLFNDDTVLSRVAAAMADPSVSAVYGDLVYVSKDRPEQVVRDWRAGEYSPARITSGLDAAASDALRAAQRVRIGGRFRYVAAYCGRLRLDAPAVARLGPPGRLHPACAGAHADGGASNRSLGNIMRKSTEIAPSRVLARGGGDDPAIRICASCRNWSGAAFLIDIDEGGNGGRLARNFANHRGKPAPKNCVGSFGLTAAAAFYNVPMKALIAGATGQDGAYLAAHLLALGHEVVGTTRDAGSADTGRLRALGIDGQLNLVSMLPSDYRSVHAHWRSIGPITFTSGGADVGRAVVRPAGGGDRKHRNGHVERAGGDPLREPGDSAVQCGVQ